MPYKPSSSSKSKSGFAKYYDANRQTYNVSKKVAKIPDGSYPFAITWYTSFPWGGRFEFKALDRNWKLEWKFYKQNFNYAIKAKHENMLKELNYALRITGDDYYNYVGQAVFIKIQRGAIRQFARYIPGAALQRRRAVRYLPNILRCSVSGIVARVAIGTVTDLEEYGAPAYSKVYIERLSRCIRQCIF